MNSPEIPRDDVTDAFFNSIFSSSPEAIVMLDHKNRVVRVNLEFTRLFGYTQEEIVGRHIDTLIAGEGEIAEANAFSKIAEKGKTLNAESTRRRKDGSPVDVSIMGAPVEKDGKVIGIYGIYRDISARKEMERKLAASEASYRELFENAPIGIFQSTSRGRFLLVNRATAEILGYQSSEEVIHHFNNLAKQLYYRPGSRDLFIQDLKERGYLQNYEVEAVKKDGTIIWLSINCRISQWVDDGSFVIDGFLNDKTNLKAAEQQIRNSLKEKDVLLQEVHHRVKNNMQIISSLLNLELMNTDEQRIIELLYVIQKRIQTMALVHEKLYSSDNVAFVELGEYTRDLTMQILDIMAGDIYIDADFELEEIYAGIDFSVPFGLIVNELVMNAYKHAFGGIESPHLFLELHKGKEELVVRLRDNGIGLPEQFNPDNLKTLGMKLIHSLVAQLGGKISFASESGTECTVELPLDRVGIPMDCNSQ